MYSSAALVREWAAERGVEGRQELSGMLFSEEPTVEGEPATRLRPQLLASGPMVLEAGRAQRILAERFGVPSDLWSATSYCQLRREAAAVDRWNRLHPQETPRTSYLEERFDGLEGPFVAVTDYVALVPEQIRPWVPGPYFTLGTDGFGRSDTKKALRRHFEVDAEQIVLSTLSALAESGRFDREELPRVMEELEIDPDQPDPATA
jgi:pyruvate dehydrogenase E1 component